MQGSAVSRFGRQTTVFDFVASALRVVLCDSMPMSASLLTIHRPHRGNALTSGTDT